jgi:hypothetical protein
MLFAHLKRNLNFRQLRLRGITGTLDEGVNDPDDLAMLAR